MAALALVACDDVGVQDTVASLLLHGGVRALADCSLPTFSAPGAPAGYTRFKVHVFADGSVLKAHRASPELEALWPAGPIEYCSRSEACAEPSFSVPYYFEGWNQIEWALADGYVTVTLSGPGITGSPDVVLSEPIDEVCTGFNLEAFGVVP